LEKIKDKLTTIKYESSMAPFNARKAWGYHEDQLVTTHPIQDQLLMHKLPKQSLMELLIQKELPP
jgi:hypothetical protein